MRGDTDRRAVGAPTGAPAVPAAAGPPGSELTSDRLFHLLARAGRVLGSSLDLDTTLEQLLDLIVPELADACVVHLLAPDGGSVDRELIRAIPALAEPVQEYIGRYGAAERPQSPIVASARTRRSHLFEPLTDADLERFARRPEQLDLLRRLKVRAILTVPIATSGRVWGAFGIALAESGTPGRSLGGAHRALIEEYAVRTGLALEHASLFRQAEAARRSAELAERLAERLQAATAALGAAETPEAVYDAIVEIAGAELGAIGSAILEPAGDGEGLVLRRAVGYGAPVVARSRTIALRSTLAAGPGAPDWLPLHDAFAFGQPVWIPSAAELERRYGRRPSLIGPGGDGSWCVLPLRVGDRVAAAVTIALPEARTLADQEHAFLVALGDQCGQALERAQLRTRAAAALRESEARFRAMVEQSSLPTAVFETSGRPVAINRAMSDRFALRLEDLPSGYSLLDDPQLGELGLGPLLRRAFAGEPVVTPPFRYDVGRTVRGRSERIVWVQAHLYPVRDPAGRVAQVVLTAIDVTDLKETEAALRTSEHRLDLALAAGRMGTFEWDVAAGTVTWSPSLEEIHGFEPGGFAGTIDAYWAEVHPNDRARLQALMPEILAGRREHRLEYRIVGRDGAVKWVEERGSVIRDETGAALRIVGVCADVTDRKHAERDLQRLGAIVRSSHDAVISKTLDGIVTTWNPSAERIFGFTAAEMIGQPIFRIIPPHLHDQERTVLRRIADGQAVEWFESERLRRDGSSLVISVTISPIHDASGAVIGASSIKRDVTEQREIRQELARQQERLRTVLEQMPAGVILAEAPSGRVLMVNPRVGEIWRQEAVLGADRRLGGTYEAYRLDGTRYDGAEWPLARALTGEVVFGEQMRIRRGDGSVGYLSVNASPIRDADGTIVAAVTTFYDITEQHRTEERLRQSAKMEAIGRLAGGLAHDFNNQLTALSGFASFVGRDPGLGAQSRQDLLQVQQAAERMAGLTRQLLAFSRQQILTPETVDVNGSVADAYPLLQRLIGSQVDIRIETLATPIWVQVDRSQLLQVLMNLAINARDAMPDGGTLWMRTRVREVTVDDVIPMADEPLATGPYAEIVVQDTGTGIPPEVLPHIFEPFFTTKEVGHGTGLGLATVHGIITQSRGRVWAEPAPGTGTTFHVLLPLAAPPKTGGRDADAPAAARRTRGRVLVVDDEDAVRQFVARTLAGDGLDVVQARHGREALERLAEARGAFDVMVSDMVMPGMSGRELREHIRQRYPALRIVWMSGYPEDSPGAGEFMGPEEPFVQKPMTPELLVHAVRRVMGRGAGGGGRGGAPGGR